MLPCHGNAWNLSPVARNGLELLDHAPRLPAEHVAAALVAVRIWHGWLSAALIIRAAIAIASGPSAAVGTATTAGPAATIVSAGGKE